MGIMHKRRHDPNDSEYEPCEPWQPPPPKEDSLRFQLNEIRGALQNLQTRLEALEAKLDAAGDA